MPRSTPEWHGKTDDTPVPERVRQRVAERAGYRCQACGMRVRFGGEIDHIIALKNGGENRERNLQFLCATHHKLKTARDVAEKSKVYQTQKRLGPLKREQSPWSKRLEAYKWNWKTRRYERIAEER